MNPCRFVSLLLLSAARQADSQTVSPAAPTPTNAINPPCEICGEGLVVTLVDVVVIIPGSSITPTCSELEQAGLDGQITTDQCPLAPLLVTSLCGCTPAGAPQPSPTPVPSSTAPTTAIPEGTSFPTATNSSCFICGSEDIKISLPDANISITGETITCRQLEKLGLRGSIRAEECPFVPVIASITCGCGGQANLEPTSAPSMNTDICHVCGDGMTVGVLDGVLELPSGTVTCGQLQEQGLAGQLEGGDCALIPETIGDVCSCVAISPTQSPSCNSSDCGSLPENNVPFSPNVKTSSPTPAPVLINPSTPTSLPNPSLTLPSSDTSSLECTDSSGSFGKTVGAASQVKYLYEAITTPETVTSALTNILTTTFEPALSAALLSGLFSAICSRRLQSRRRLDVIGLDAKPNDELVGTATCVSETNGNRCTVVRGVFTLYSDEGTDISGMIDVALERIQVSMEQGAFDRLDSRLVAVRFRTEALPVIPSTDKNNTTVETQPSAQSSPSAVPVWAWVLIGVGIVILNGIVCFFFCRRRKQSRDFNADSNDDYDDEDANKEGLRRGRKEQREDSNDDSSYDLGGGSNMFNPSRGGYSHQVGGDPNETMLMMNSIGNL